MPVADATRAVALPGALVQLGVTLLVAGLVASLWRGAPRRSYLTFWAAGWAVLLVATIAVVLRHATGPVPIGRPDRPWHPVAVLLHAVLQTARLLFLALVLLGCRSFSGRSPGRRAATIALLGAGAMGLILGLHPDLNRVLAWQALFAVPAYAAGAGLVVPTWRARRGVGAPLLVAALAGLCALWTLYGVAFWSLDAAQPTRFLEGLAAYSAFGDAGFTMLLSLGMVMAYVEDTHAEASEVARQQVDNLRRSERRLAAVLAAAHDGIISLDADRRITDLNPAAERIFGTTEARGEPFDGFVDDAHRARLWTDLATATRRSEAHPAVALRREVTGRRGDGSEFPLEVAISSIDDAGRGYVVVARDLTERTRLESEREQLQQQVAEAARLETVGRTVSGVAHELNNPLAAIMAFAEDLLVAARSPGDRDAATVILQQAQRCRVIVGDLLILGRNRRHERRRVAPADLIHRVLRVFGRESTRHGVTLDTAVDPDLPHLDVDPAGIEQVLTNLLTNALQATPSGGRVAVRARALADSLEIVVEDTGPGIPPDLLTRVFEPFFTTKEPGMGTGLGLSVSHALVRQHGGTLDVENRSDGPGARFVVRIPFVDRREAARDSSGTVADTIPQPPASVTRRALVIDDEEAIRVAMCRSLERRGWQVDQAVDGREALRRLDTRRGGEYDAIVTDLRMPGMSGIEVCEAIAARHPRLADRVVIVTGDTTSPAVASFLATGRHPHLQKPFDMRVLVELLERMAVARGGAA